MFCMIFLFLKITVSFNVSNFLKLIIYQFNLKTRQDIEYLY